jgi:hypothetical protein
VSLDTELLQVDIFEETAGACRRLPGVCPYELCRHNLAHTRVRGGMVVETRPGCSLEYADRGGMTLEEVADVLGVTRERIRQIQAHALAHFHENGRVLGVVD